MRIAMPVASERISPVLDAANIVMLIELRNDDVLRRETRAIASMSFCDLIAFFTSIQIDIMICGALSRPLHRALVCAGIKVIPWKSGMIDEILAAYLGNSLDRKQFSMPGCCRKRTADAGQGHALCNKNRRRKGTII